MTIHHTQIKKAEKIGVTLSEDGDATVGFWPKRSLKIYGSSASDVMAQMQAAQVVLAGDDYRMRTDGDTPRLVTVIRAADGFVLKGSPMPPVAAHKAISIRKDAEWVDPTPFAATPSAAEQTEIEQVNKDTVERINGVAIDGAVAYAEGTPAGDCPYSSEGGGDDENEHADGIEYDNFVRWNEEWDAAADEAGEEEDAGKGSVVKEKYRAIYAERGHPTHCGDWLANTLNELCANKGGTNLDLFEEICGLNGVDTSKYKRDGVGWQGRIRMTGRNLMAKKVFQNNGVLVLPETLHGGSMLAPGEWMDQQRFKRQPKADPTGETIAVATK